MISSSFHFFSNGASKLKPNLETDELFGLITGLEFTPPVILTPTFRSRWTQYSISVPYETVSLNLQVFPTQQTSDVFLENEQQLSEYAIDTNELSMTLCFCILFNYFFLSAIYFIYFLSSARNVTFSVGLGWNSYLLRAVNRNANIKPIFYEIRIKRQSRLGNSMPFDANKLVSCALQQVLIVYFLVSYCGRFFYDVEFLPFFLLGMRLEIQGSARMWIATNFRPLQLDRGSGSLEAIAIL